MERLTDRNNNQNDRRLSCMGRCYNAGDCINCDSFENAVDRLAEYENAEERGELVRVVRCDGCVSHVDNGYHYCKKLRIDCPLSDFYCAYGKAALKEV